MDYAIILAGGIGSRFWPFSRELEPKQFMQVLGQSSLLQNTVQRLKGIIAPKRIYFVTNKAYFYELKAQISKFRIPDENILLEPEGRNTAPAIGLCAKLLGDLDQQATLVVLPADHYIENSAQFKAAIVNALACAQGDLLVTIGIRPKKPATGYGYIKVRPRAKEIGAKARYYEVERFLEKPGMNQARAYAKDRRYFWNSGIFIWKAQVFLKEMRAFLPDLYETLRSVHSQGDILKAWPKIKPISVDYGIMEYSKKLALIPAGFKWTDLGSWDALQEVLSKDKKGNISSGDCFDLGSRGLCVYGRGNRLISTIGLTNLIIADTPDALLVCNRDRAQDVKKIVGRLKNLKRSEQIRHLTEKRPWGNFCVLRSGPGFKIKLIEIKPHKRLSLQSHSRRTEHWVVVSGRAKVIYGRKQRFLNTNESFYVQQGARHRLENPFGSLLKIVEVQAGNYLEEDDIKRFGDDFRR